MSFFGSGPTWDKLILLIVLITLIVATVRAYANYCRALDEQARQMKRSRYDDAE